MNLREMLEKRHNLKEKGIAIVNRADSENRKMTSAENTEYENLRKEIDRLDGDIKAEEARREEERNLPTCEMDDPFENRRVEGKTYAISNSDSVRSFVKDRGRYDREIANLHPGQILRAMATGAKNEQERRALSVGLDTSGGYTVPEILSASLIDNMRAKSVMNRAGVRTLPVTGDTSFARVTADPSPTWRQENTAVDEDEPTFGALVFRPRSLAVLCKVSMELLQDSVNVEDALVNSLSQAMALELDRACMIGIGAEGEPKGLIYWDDVHEVAVDGFPGYDDILEARTDILTSNSPDPNAVIMHPREEGFFTRLKDGEGLPYPVPPALSSMQFLTSTQIPITLGGGSDSIMLTGYFRDAVIAMRTELRIEVLKELYMGNLQYGFIAYLRADFAPEHDECFAQLTGVQAT